MGNCNTARDHTSQAGDRTYETPLTSALADRIAVALQGVGFPVQGPDVYGSYTTSTAICHDGATPDALVFGPSIGARCPQCENALPRLLAQAGLTEANAQEDGAPPADPTASLGNIEVGFLWPRSTAAAFPDTVQDTIRLSIALHGISPGSVKHPEDTIDLAKRSKQVRDQLPTGDLDAPEHKAAKDKYKRRKSVFPAIISSTGTPKGTKRIEIPPESHNGLYLFDLDENLPPFGPELKTTLEDIRRDVSRHPSTVCVALSVSGRALWALIRGPVISAPDERERVWQAMKDTIPGLEHAAAGQCDLGRLRFLAHDEDAYVNLNAKVFEAPTTEPGSDRDGAHGASAAAEDTYQEPHDGTQDWTPPSEWLQDLASAIEARGVGVEAPSGPDGEYRTSTRVCHGGDSDGKLHFSIRGAHCFTRNCTLTWKSLAEWAGIPLWWEKNRNSSQGSHSRNRSGREPGQHQQGRRRGTQGNGQPTTRPAPQIILPSLPEQQPYPVPTAIAPFARAIHQLAGCSLPTAVMCALGSVNLLTCEDRDVKGLAHMPFPTSLMLLVSSRSGGRKSTAFNLSFQGHVEADEVVERRWEEAKEVYREWAQAQAKSKKPSDDSGPPRPRASGPWSIRSDITIQAFAKRLLTGRPTQALASAEAGKTIGKGSWSFSGEQIHKTLSDLSDLFSEGSLGVDRSSEDTEFHFRHRRSPVILLGQPRKLLPLIFSEASADGFTARSLISHDHVRPQEPAPYEWQNTSAAEVIGWWARLIMWQRAVQDEDLEYAPSADGMGKEAVARPVLAIDDEATGQLRDFYERCTRMADGEISEHEESWWVRAPELTARVAATLAMAQWYREAYAQREAPRLAVVGPGAMAEAIKLVGWHGRELHRIAGLATAQQDAAAAQWVADNMASCMGKKGIGQGKAEDGTEGAILIRSYMARWAAGTAHYLRGDTEARARVLVILEEHGRVIPAGKTGWYFPQHVESVDEGYDWGWDDDLEGDC